MALVRTRRGPDTDSLLVTDPTTGLPARAHLHDWAQEATDRSNMASNRSVVAFVDVGLVRDVNDTFGADVGDQLLRAVGDRLAAIDLPGTRALRYEGAEFAVIFEQINLPEVAQEICRYLIELLSEPFTIGIESITVTPTVGAAVSADNYRALDDYLRDAHRALVRARDQGLGTYAVHDESKRGRYETRFDETRLATALDDEEFLLAYQPIVRLDTDQIIGFEALLRWKAPGATNTGMLFPQDFLPMLEKSSISVRVGDWVLREACRQAAEWNARFPDRPALFITCNVGPRQLASPDFRDSVVRAVRDSGVQPWQVCLDITEQALRFNRSSAWSGLRELKDLSIKLGLDDFGTGVSSLTYLREFQLDLVRIDRSFVTDIHLSKEDRAIVQHMVGLAHDLGLVVVAEGIEAPEQADVLRRLGVDMAQGFHFGRPALAGETLNRLDPTQVAHEWTTEQVLGDQHASGA